MKVLGIIAEYNPFHNGHLYHLVESKALCGADYTVCVMSGNYIQRGEPAVINKWSRAEMALSSGIDLVIELPFPYAVSSAENFAFGAVKILHSLGIVDFLSFGSESGSINELETVSDILFKEPEEYRKLLKAELDKGISFPSARENALNNYMRKHAPGALSTIVSSANNILGIEYLKALKRLDSKILPITVPRIKNAYNSKELTGNISSATSIRRHIESGTSPYQDDMLYTTMPLPCAEILNRDFQECMGPVFFADFEKQLLTILRKMSVSELAEYPYVNEGLENRIKEASEAGSLAELIDRISTRRYTRTRVQRILLSILTGFKAKDMESFTAGGGPQYARILGFNDNGRKLLSLMNKNSTIPPLVKTADLKKEGSPTALRMLELESMATDLYVLAYKSEIHRKSAQEFTNNPIINLIM